MTATHFDDSRSRRQTAGITLVADNYTHGGVKYKLLGGYPKITASDEQLTAQEKYLIQASDVEAFQLESMPPPVIMFGFSILPLRRHMPGFPALRTKSITYEPQSPELPGDPFGIDSYALEGSNTAAPDGTYDPYYTAMIDYEADFRSNQEQDPNDPETYLEVSLNAGGQFLSIPPNKTKLVNADVDGNPEAGEDNTPAGRSTGLANQDRQMPMLKSIPTLEWSIRKNTVLNPPWEYLFGNLGKLNSDEPPLFRFAPKETILFSGLSARQERIWRNGRVIDQPWTLDYKFSQRLVTEGNRTFGWNHVYSPNHGGWRYARRANNDPLYESFAMSNVFQ